ncbi:LOW QUALITY PROTEIN: hypothetical protein HID58_042844, partial [Brassica napus]
ILGKHAQDPPGSKKARHKDILALIVAYLRGQIAILHKWQRINGRVQLAVSSSLFGMDTTAHHKQHYQDEHAERPPCQKSRYNPETWQEATATTLKPQGASSMLNRHEDLNESPLHLLQAQEAQERPGGSSMRILSFGLRILLNLLIPLILSLAKILPLIISGYMSNISIWGMSRSITLYAYAPGFSIKPSANSDQSPPWGEHLILMKEKKKLLQAQLDPTR